MKKTFLQIGGGHWSLLLMTYYKSQGYLIALVDKNQNASGVTLADFFLHTDGQNERDIIAFVEDLAASYCIDKVNIAGEFAIPTLSAISKLDIVRCLSEFDDGPFIDKRKFYEILDRAHVETKIVKVAYSLSELRKYIYNNNLPSVVKPSIGSGSQGVFILHDLMDCKYAIKVISKSKKLLSAFGNGGYIVERYINGTEINFYGVMAEGNLNLISAIEKETKVISCSPRWSRSYLINKCDCQKSFSDVRLSMKKIANFTGLDTGFFSCALLGSRRRNSFLEASPILGLDHIILKYSHYPGSNPSQGTVTHKHLKNRARRESSGLVAVYGDQVRQINGLMSEFAKKYGYSKYYALENKNKGNLGNDIIKGFVYAQTDCRQNLTDFFDQVQYEH